VANLQIADIKKRDNAEILVNRIVLGIPFNTSSGDFLVPTHNIKINGVLTDVSKIKKLEDIYAAVFSAKTVEFEATVNGTGSKTFYSVTKVEKDPEFAGKAAGSKTISKSDSERQERGLVAFINEYTKKIPNLTIDGIGGYILGAIKQEGLSSLGQEPYIDVLIKTTKGDVGISCKDQTAPSLAGGGLKGLITIDKQLIDTLHETTKKIYAKEGFVEGGEYSTNDLQDLYIEIPESNIYKILAGTPAMGGPVDMMYIGPMDVTASLSGSKLKLNGNFYDVREYSRKYTFYFRLRKRDVINNKVTVDFSTLNASGYPNILAQKTGGKASARWVIQNSVPSNNKAHKLK
jgi:hypothetical protein